MKTSIKNRLLRLGILCAGIGSFAVAIFASVAMTVIQKQSSDVFGKTVAASVVSSLQEEMVYLPDGLREASAGEHSDIFDNVFEIGQPQRYDYSTFEQECRELPENGVLLTGPETPPVQYTPGGWLNAIMGVGAANATPTPTEIENTGGQSLFS